MKRTTIRYEEFTNYNSESDKEALEIFKALHPSAKIIEITTKKIGEDNEKGRLKRAYDSRFREPPFHL